RYPHRVVREGDPVRAPTLLAEDTEVSLVQRTRPDGLAGTGVDGGQRAALVPTCHPDATGSVSEGERVAVQAVGAEHLSRPIVDPLEGSVRPSGPPARAPDSDPRVRRPAQRADLDPLPCTGVDRSRG